MAYDERLAERIRRVLPGDVSVRERKMFGGLAFMLDGHMACGVMGPDLMLRIGAGPSERALAEAHVRRMDFTGKPLKGFVYVAPEGVASEETLAPVGGAGSGVCRHPSAEVASAAAPDRAQSRPARRVALWRPLCLKGRRTRGRDTGELT